MENTPSCCPSSIRRRTSRARILPFTRVRGARYGRLPPLGRLKACPRCCGLSYSLSELPVTGRGWRRGYFLTPPLQAKFSKKQKQQRCQIAMAQPVCAAPSGLLAWRRWGWLSRPSATGAGCQSNRTRFLLSKFENEGRGRSGNSFAAGRLPRYCPAPKAA